jgi:rare lipoprotein A
MTKTTKLVFMVLIGLAMIEFSAGQSLNAATSSKATKASFVATKKTASAAKSTKNSYAAKPVPSMQGLAAVYSDRLSGRKTSSGQRFSQEKLTAAHRTLPLGTKVLVTNVRTNKSVEVSINDRGPRHRSRVIDLSSAAASKIGMRKTGCALVQLKIVNGSSTSNS